MHAIAHKGVWTPKESLCWKLTLVEKSLAPGNQTSLSRVPVWPSTNWATSPTQGVIRIKLRVSIPLSLSLQWSEISCRCWYWVNRWAGKKLQWTHPRKLSHEPTALEDVPDVDVSARTAGHQRASVFLVRPRLEEQELADAQVTIHCTKLFTHIHRNWLHKAIHKCVKNKYWEGYKMFFDR